MGIIGVARERGIARERGVGRARVSLGVRQPGRGVTRERG